MQVYRRIIALLCITLSCGSFEREDAPYAEVGPYQNCVTEVPEVEGAYISTQIEFSSPKFGSVHPLGVDVKLSVGVVILPRLPPKLASRTKLCFEVKRPQVGNLACFVEDPACTNLIKCFYSFAFSFRWTEMVKFGARASPRPLRCPH